MKNVLKQSKVTEFQQLKRPKTNYEVKGRQNKNVGKSTFALHSQRDSLHLLDGVISSERDVKVTKTNQSPRDPAGTTIQKTSDMTIMQ